MSPISSAGVIGAGAWGTALAQVCARAGLTVTLWAREPEVAEDIARNRRNSRFLPDVELDPAIDVTTELADLSPWDIVLAVPPAQHMRSTLQQFAGYARDGLPIILCSKGIEQRSLSLMTEVLAETVPQALPAVLSGPSFAGEVARGLPTAVTLACPDEDLGSTLVQTIATPSFRPYLSGDMIGAEAGGAIKNVLAIACGIVEGAGLGDSARAALISRGLAEMSRFAAAFGGFPETVRGLSGLGDLVLTATSHQSRNLRFGIETGRTGRASLPSGELVEGAHAAAIAARLSVDKDIEMPVTNAVASIIEGRLDVKTAMNALMSRPITTE
ncbi:MAG: hypothetical protein JWO33_1456 [Caulobacteraceae bacterium]|nr:hypothetical protein [Caulobacteraceae bacterium]